LYNLIQNLKSHKSLYRFRLQCTQFFQRQRSIYWSEFIGNYTRNSAQYTTDD